MVLSVALSRNEKGINDSFLRLGLKRVFLSDPLVDSAGPSELHVLGRILVVFRYLWNILELLPSPWNKWGSILLVYPKFNAPAYDIRGTHPSSLLHVPLNGTPEWETTPRLQLVPSTVGCGAFTRIVDTNRGNSLYNLSHMVRLLVTESLVHVVSGVYRYAKLEGRQKPTFRTMDP